MNKPNSTGGGVRAVRRSLLLAGIGLILLPAGVAVAGGLANFQANWGAFVGGGISNSASAVVVDAVGEPVSGTSASQSAIIEAGVLVPLSDAQPVTSKQWLYLPEVVK